MSGTLFRDETARATLRQWFERFRQRIPSPTESRTVATRYGRTHLLVGGAVDAPPIVLLHGALISSAHVLVEMAPLLERFRVYALDIVGQSVMSEERTLSVKGDDYGHWLADVLDALSFDRVRVVAASFGGFVAQRLAALAPARIERLVLLVPAGMVRSHWSGWFQVGIPMALYLARPTERRLQAFVRHLRTTPDPEWEAYLGDVFHSVRLSQQRIPRLSRPGEFAGYHAPTLVIGADGDLSFPGVPLLRRAQRLLPGAETELIRGARHMPPTTDEFRQWLGARIGRFLLEPAPAPRT